MTSRKPLIIKGELSAKALILKAGQKEVNDELGSLGKKYQVSQHTMKKVIIVTAIWACIALIPSGLYLNHRHTQRENDALQIRDQVQLLRNAFIQGDYTNALKSLFTPAFRSEVALGAINFPRLYDWVTNRDYYFEDPHAKIRFWGDIGMLYPTRPQGTPDIRVELQKIDGRWYFNGEVIPIVD